MKCGSMKYLKYSKKGQKQFPSLLASKKQLKHNPGKATSHTNQNQSVKQARVNINILAKNPYSFPNPNYVDQWSMLMSRRVVFKTRVLKKQQEF